MIGHRPVYGYSPSPSAFVAAPPARTAGACAAGSAAPFVVMAVTEAAVKASPARSDLGQSRVAGDSGPVIARRRYDARMLVTSSSGTGSKLR